MKEVDFVNKVPAAALDAADWLLHSGIQSQSIKPSLNGGVAAWYEIHSRRWPFLYSEITGYAITTFMFLNRLIPRPIWKEAASRAAQWLSSNAFHPSGGVRTRQYLVKNYQSPNYAFHSGRVYAFDTAMVGYGLLQLLKVAPDKKLWKRAQQAHGFLSRTLKARNGLIYPYYDARARRGGQTTEKWSDQTGGFHGKLALFFIDYYRLTGQESHRRDAAGILDAVLKLQQKDGRFITNRADGSTHLHPHCYALEGLLYGGVLLKEKRYLRAVVKGMEWVRRAVAGSGSVSEIHYVKSGFAHHERSDIVAQVIRIASALEGLGLNRGLFSSELLKNMVEHLLMFQFCEEDAHGGGFLYGADTDGRLRIHLNAWGTMFALQALCMHEAFVVKRQPVDLECFV